MNEASIEVGKHEAEEFNVSCFSECVDWPINSPIEQILYTAIKAIRVFNAIEDGDTHYDHDGKEYGQGLNIWPQHIIGKYRVDFFVTYISILEPTKMLAVECDSQEWHEQTEQQRRYEKKRDRFLISRGYKIFHYTGKEILENPYKVAAEIIKEVTGCDEIFQDSGIE